MRIQNSFFFVVALAFTAVTAIGTVYTDSYQQVSQSQGSDFDALAHDLFGELVGHDQAGDRSK